MIEHETLKLKIPHPPLGFGQWFINVFNHRAEFMSIRDSLQYNEWASRMRNMRRGVFPTVPQTIQEINRKLLDFEDANGFYRGCAVGVDGSMGFVFIREGMVGPLSRCMELFLDGTFKVK